MNQDKDRKPVVLLTGGSGFIGSALTIKLRSRGFVVRSLTTSRSRAKTDPDFFFWNIQDNNIDEEALIGVDHIVNLAGANVAKGLWTKNRKMVLTESRVQGSQLLLRELASKGNHLKSYLGASAVGYYGNMIRDNDPDENSKAGNDFLAELCVQWEAVHKEFKQHCDQLVIARISNVVASSGGLIEPFRLMSKTKMGVYLGSGENRISWIGLETLAEAMVQFILQNQSGTFNMVSGNMTWKEFQRSVFQELGPPLAENHLSRLPVEGVDGGIIRIDHR